MRLESINRNDNGDWYVIYSLPSGQTMNASCRKKREVIIWGIPKKNFKNHLPHLLDNCDEE